MIKEFYKQVINEKGRKMSVLDFHSVVKNRPDINMFFILSEREQQGKSYNMLDYVKDKWDNNKERAVFILNTQDLFDLNIHKLIAANKRIEPEKWKGTRVNKRGIFDKSGELFCSFVALTTYYKFKIGGRDPSITTIFYDEFNEGLRSIGTSQSQFLENIINSTNEGVKVFIFGNRLSVNVPLLTHLGYLKIDKEWVEIKKGKMKISFYVPKIPKEAKKRLEDGRDWRYFFSKEIGLAEMSFLNESDLDSYEGVVPKEYQVQFKINTANEYLFFTKREWAKIYTFDKNGKKYYYLHFQNEEPNFASAKIVIKQKKIDNNLEYSRFIVETFLNALLENRVFYSDYIVKHLFTTELTKF